MASLPPFRAKPFPKGISHHAPLLMPGLLALLGATYPSIMLGLGAAACVLIAAFRVVQRTRERHTSSVFRSSKTVVAAIAAVCLLTGIYRGFYWVASTDAAAALARRGLPVKVTILPLEYSEDDGSGRKPTFKALAWTPNETYGRWLGVQATAFPRDASKLIPGVPVQCTATFEEPSPAMNPGGFDYREYLLSRRVVSLLEVRHILSAESDEAPAPKHVSALAQFVIRARSDIKKHIEKVLDNTFPRNEAAILKGMFLADRRDLAAEDSQDFKRSGFYRFIAICGFHVDVLAAMVESAVLLATKRRDVARFLSICAAFGYAGLSGWTAGAIRAFVCSSMRALSSPLRRKYHALAGIGVSALVAAWVIPCPLADTGLLLSFSGAGGALLGGVYADAVASAFAERIGRTRLRIASVFVRVVTMSAVLLPIAAASFAEVSLVSFALGGIWGILAAVLIPLSALIAFVPYLGASLGWLPFLLLQGIRALSRILSSLPFAGMVVPAPGVLEIAAHWGLLLLPLTFILQTGRSCEDACAFFGRRRALVRLRQRVLAVASFVLLCASVVRVFVPWPEATFLYVGQGDCAIVRYGCSVMVVDTGTATAFGDHVAPYLRARGINHVDLCVVSHLHADHVGGLPILCSEVPVSAIAVSPGFAEQTMKIIAEQVPFADDSLPQVLELVPGREYEWAGVPMRVVLPCDSLLASGAITDPTNESSLVFVLDFGPFSFEFWGDSPATHARAAFDANQWLSSSGGVTIVKVPHHGSKDAYDARLYERAGSGFLPYSVVSVGPNSYGHPSKQVIDAAGKGGRVFRTDEAGAVTFKCVLGRVYVDTFVPVPGRRTGPADRSVRSSD